MIREINENDREIYIKMAEEFYATDAVMQSVPKNHFERAFDELMRSDEYIKAYIFEFEGNIAGYSLLATSYSQEAGGKVLWIDEIYILPKYRRKGLADEFFDFTKKKFFGNYVRLRLEAEDYNNCAIGCYKKHGFIRLPYIQMIKDL